MRGALTVLCLGLLGVVAVELNWEAGSAPSAAPPAASPASSSGASAAPAADAAWQLAPIERYAEVVERPLFVPARRPPRAPGGAPAPEAAGGGLRLVGVLLDARRQVALLRDGDSPWLVRVQPGEALGDWTLAEVHRDHVVLRRGAATRIVAVEP